MAKAKQINKTPILAIILVSYFMIVLDISMVITALPKIRFDLSFSPTGLSWVQNSYTLAFGGLLLLGARAGDILGRKRMFAFGLALFTSGSFGVGMAPSMSFLIGCRVMQGVGAAIFAPSTLAILQINFVEGQERTRAVAYYGAVTGVATSIGLVLGGIFADLLSWRIGFFVNLPIGICLILAIYRYIEETPKRSGHFDFLGAFSSVFGMSALVYGIVRSATYGWDDQVTNLALIIGAILLLFLILNEKHAKVNARQLTQRAFYCWALLWDFGFL
jgi:MFS family permease